MAIDRSATPPQTALERDMTTHARALTGTDRLARAERRDRLARARDAAAAARDERADALDTELGRAFVSRAQAAAQRAAARRDRQAAAADREAAATDRRAAADDIAAQGIDHLTGALRRGVGLAAIQREIDRTRRTGEPMTIAFVDVDGLKAVNDTHGHAAGDALLQGVAECIQHVLRPYDLVLRYGGDEIVCALPGQDLARAEPRFDEITTAVRRTLSGHSVSVGLIQAQPHETLDDMIGRADAEMIASRVPR